jgi:hypothetical protein
MDMTFGKLDGLSGIADDTFIYGKNEAEHDQCIIDVLETAGKNNVRFNSDKFQFKVEALFFGLTWTPGGIRPDERKIKSIRDMPSPSNLTELQSFLGMVNYLTRFSPMAIVGGYSPMAVVVLKLPLILLCLTLTSIYRNQCERKY